MLQLGVVVLILHQQLTSTEAISCIQCSSQQAGCDQGTLPSTGCPAANDSCYSLTISDGFELERGCLSLLPDEDLSKCANASDTRCLVCSDSNSCNSQNWHKCHQCSKSTNNRCAFTPNRIEFCRNYKANDWCYEKVDGNELTRGCLSDLEEGINPCEGNKYCLTCDGDSCNGDTQDELKTVTRCVQCKEGEFRCVDGTAANSECDERVDKCYIKMWKDMELDRGCLKKLSQEEQNRCTDEADRSCYSCTGNSCNNHHWIKCYQCSPQLNSTCEDEQTNKTLSVYCKHFQVNDRCYAKLNGVEVIRGCASDLGTDADPCSGNRNCVSCSTDACNSISEAYLKNPPKMTHVYKIDNYT